MSASAKVKRRSVAKALYVLSEQKYSSNRSESPSSEIRMTWPLLLLGTPGGTFPGFRPLHDGSEWLVQALRWRLRAWYSSG